MCSDITIKQYEYCHFLVLIYRTFVLTVGNATWLAMTLDTRPLPLTQKHIFQQ